MSGDLKDKKELCEARFVVLPCPCLRVEQKLLVESQEGLSV